MAFKPIVAATWKQDERVAVRMDVIMKAFVREQGSFKFDVDVIDLSVTGCRIETSANLRPDSQIFISVPGIAPLPATVAWRAGWRYGCAFLLPLHQAVLDHIVKQYRKR